ncbi:hypothetical protein LOTGIDRAFT_229820 [Lottia gigantea]|uniref:MARVEL domain-containing protein n=1 Tax=Lottia gigantea TaxID=225164 RepID=V4B2P8_LOTGI|nr:hypothetical protein LOTGIDRAFT_229820 [Lottia gigantea]ESO82804.1 hypothetical protein LOTGIDRAFT_229820 [Lottia gigantea]
MSNPTDDSPDPVKVDTPTPGSETIEIFGIKLDFSYMKSIPGMLRVGEIFLTLIAFSCVAASRNYYCDYKYASGYNYFEFVSISAFISTLIIYIMYIVDLHNKFVFKFVPWKLADCVWCGVYTLFFFIASCVLASNGCSQGGNKAGAAFGFFSTIAIGADGFLAFWELRAERMCTTTHRSPATIDVPEQY